MPRPASVTRVLRAIADARQELAAWEPTDTQIALAVTDLEDAMVALSVLRHELRERRSTVGVKRG